MTEPPAHSLFAVLRKVGRGIASRSVASTQTARLGERKIIAEGLSPSFWTDLHHHAMVASWPVFFASLLLVFVFINFCFALLYVLGDEPIANARPGNFLDLFFFSVETIATVGYGDMHPRTTYGHVVATLGTFTGITSLAVVAGLVFTRFSRPRARLVFARNPVIARHNGERMLMIRFANARHNVVTDATAKLWMVRSERTAEGTLFRRIRRLDLVRDESPMFALTWTVMHRMDEASPLAGWSAADFSESDATLIVTLSGLDETSNQFVHARKEYGAGEILPGRNYADIIRVDAEGITRLNYSRFDETAPSD
jgi:inward rectifier potassium channel